MIAGHTSRLAELAASLGEAVAGAGNRPIGLDDPDTAWFVEQGALDVFLVEYENGAPVSNAKHLLRAGPGQVVFGVDGKGTPLAAVAKGLQESMLRRVSLAELLEWGAGPELAGPVDAWVSEFGAAVARQIEPRPRPDLLLSPTEPQDVEAEGECVLSTRPGGVVWAAAPAGAAYLGTEEPDGNGTGLVPLTSDTWLTLSAPARIAGRSSRELSDEQRLAPALAEFHRLALGAEQLNRRLSLADEVNEQTSRAAHRRTDQERARQNLYEVLGAPRVLGAQDSDESGSALLAALELIGKHEGIVFRRPPRRRESASRDHSLQDIMNASGIRRRKVRLTPEDRWWLGDSGAMLGFRREDGRPVALLPGAAGRYRAVDPVTRSSTRLDAGRAEGIDQEVWFFYRPLPDNQAIGEKDLLRLAGKSMAAAFARFAISGTLAGLLTLAPAIAVGMLVGWALPAASGGMLVQVVIALAAFAVVGLLLNMLQGTAMMRLEGRAAARLSAALWDRALGLPPRFFRGFTAGELAMRMSVFQELRDKVTGVAANALLSLVFLLPALGLLFIYDATLAWLSLGVMFLSLAITATFGLLQMAPQRQRYEAQRRLAGQLFQFINGMNKLRSAGAEASAFASWARNYRELYLATIRVARINEHLVAFSAATPTLVGAMLFAAALWLGSGPLAVGDFLVIFTVSMVLYAAVSGVGLSFEVLAAVLPGYEQVKPVLEAQPERRTEGAHPGELSGDIRLDRVSFRYAEDGPLILDDVSIAARPGEFVAIVGESGAGKSTLLRLALGLEDPTSGGVYYGGLDLAHLDRRAVRRQTGVVMQDSILQPGTILDNIIGLDDDLTIDDAWRAVALAAVDRDIAAMPMEMGTPIGDSASIFSGGQVQRIRIAAALVRNPRIVFLDESTSWLDARSQAEVMQGIESLAATRIVIAHRLSTIRTAERIYVMQAGRVAQQGNFEELYEAEGPFRELVQRQLT